MRRSKDRIPAIFLERPAVVQAIGHTLHLPVAGRGIESHDSASAKTGGIILIHHTATAEDRTQGIRSDRHRLMLPMNQVLADRMPPVHIPPHRAIRIVLIGARNGTDQPLSLDTRMVILRATRAVFNQAYKDGHTTMVPNFKGLIHAGNRRRLNALTVEEVLKLWEYWLASPDKQSKYARAVGRWLLLYCLNGMNTIDMAKLVWTEKAAVSQKFPQFVFIRSKIDRANKPVGKQLDETSVPIIPQLRQLLDVYASPYSPGELVFPDIFLNAVTDEQKAIRVHDYNRRISKNIKDVCESLGIQCVTPQYARNSFISALAHHGVMTAYIDYAVGHATSEVSALLAGYISNVTPAMMQAFNEKIFIIPPIQ